MAGDAVQLSLCHRLSSLFTYVLNGFRKGDEHLAYAPVGAWQLFSLVLIVPFLARDSMPSALYAIVRPSVCLSVCPSVTRLDQSKTVEARIMQFSPYSIPIPLVFGR